MGDVPKGVIRHREYGTQCRDYSGLRFGNITPTDLDGLIEYHNRGYVLIETKYKHTQLPGGQRLALERLCDDLQKVKPTLLVVASHEANGDIDVANTEVSEFRFRGTWRQREGTAGQLISAFIGYLDGLWNERTTECRSTTHR